jgi:hypothetical protein
MHYPLSVTANISNFLPSFLPIPGLVVLVARLAARKNGVPLKTLHFDLPSWFAAGLFSVASRGHELSLLYVDTSDLNFRFAVGVDISNCY